MSVFKIQLMAYGEQDYFLTGNPQISFFKKVYRRHTHFSKETIDIPFIKDGFSSKFDCHFKANIPRMGELLSRLSLEIDVIGTLSGTGDCTVDNFTNCFIKNSQIKINEFVIEESLSQWRLIKHELTTKSTSTNKIMSSQTHGGKDILFNTETDGGSQFQVQALDPTNANGLADDNGVVHKYSGPRTVISNEDRIGGFGPLIFTGKLLPDPSVQDAGPQSVNSGTALDTVKKKVIYDFDFWFTRNIGMALPIICLYNNEVILEFDTEKELSLRGTLNGIAIDKLLLKGEFIHLYGDEKRRFTNSSHEYLIEQLQYKNKLTTTTSNDDPLPQQTVSINSFNHPVKFITWAVQNSGATGMGPCYFVSMTKSNLYGEDGTEGDFTLELNGVESYKKSPMIYYTRYDPYKLCGVVPDLDRIGLYSFCLNPFDNQPSGTCNMSKLRDAKLKFSFSNNNLDTIRDKRLFVFAVNYNVFQINTNGMGGLLFV